MGIRNFWRFQPRDSHGRWTDGPGSGPSLRIPGNLQVGGRISTRSASLTVGKRLPVVPGKLNVYVGGLVRVERANRGEGLIDKKIDAATSSLVQRLPGGLQGVAQSLVDDGKIRQGNTLISVGGLRPSSPTVNVRRTGTQRPTQTGGVRSPNRKPRANRGSRLQPGGDTITDGFSSIQGEQRARRESGTVNRTYPGGNTYTEAVRPSGDRGELVTLRSNGKTISAFEHNQQISAGLQADAKKAVAARNSAAGKKVKK